MLDRRTFIVATLALAARAVGAAPPGINKPAVRADPDAGVGNPKKRAIDAIALPPGFNGALAYGRGGRVEHARYAGFADVEAGTPITPATQYKWGSASKWLTTAAVLRLAEQGALSLDAPVVTYLPDFRRDTGERVKIWHLLSNTSGLPDLLSQQLKVEPELRTSTATAAAIVARFGGGDLAFPPSGGWDYAALNWAIVAAIVERVAGEPLASAVERLVLRPLGMARTGFAQAGQPPLPELAAAYASVQPPPPVRKMQPVPAFLAASGNAAGPVEDALRAAHGIFHGSLLSPASRQALLTVHWPAQDYALGGRVHRLDGESWAWETGKVQGYRAHIAHRLSRSETVAVFNTTDLDQAVLGAWVEAIARA